MARYIALLVLVVVSTVFSGCASDSSGDTERVSTIPWNRPEKWEGQGPLGGFSQQGH